MVAAVAATSRSAADLAGAKSLERTHFARESVRLDAILMAARDP
jgi:hypothetical protein